MQALLDGDEHLGSGQAAGRLTLEDATGLAVGIHLPPLDGHLGPAGELVPADHVVGVVRLLPVAALVDDLVQAESVGEHRQDGGQAVVPVDRHVVEAGLYELHVGLVVILGGAELPLDAVSLVADRQQDCSDDRIVVRHLGEDHPAPVALQLAEDVLTDDAAGDVEGG